MIRPLFLLLALVGLAACNSPLTPAANSSIVSLAADYTVKKVEKRYDVECSVFNILESGEYCIHKYKATDRQEVHCFKTLGGVDCYTERDPYLLAGRSLPTAPRQLADPRMPMEPPPNRLLRVVENFDNDAHYERLQEENRAAAAKAQAEREDKQKVEPAQVSPAALPQAPPATQPAQ